MTFSCAVGSPASFAAAGAIAARYVGHDHLGDAEPERVVDDERDRTSRDRVRRELVPVAGHPAHAEERRARGHRPVVVGERGDVDGRRVGAEQLAQIHRTTPA
jgi:hypothetical protein